jgi:hypothetical protein
MNYLADSAGVRCEMKGANASKAPRSEVRAQKE